MLYLKEDKENKLLLYVVSIWEFIGKYICKVICRNIVKLLIYGVY